MDERIKQLEERIKELEEQVAHLYRLLHMHGNAISSKVSAGEAEMIIRSIISEKQE